MEKPGNKTKFTVSLSLSFASGAMILCSTALARTAARLMPCPSSSTLTTTSEPVCTADRRIVPRRDLPAIKRSSAVSIPWSSELRNRWTRWFGEPIEYALVEFRFGALGYQIGFLVQFGRKIVDQPPEPAKNTPDRQHSNPQHVIAQLAHQPVDLLHWVREFRAHQSERQPEPDAIGS